VSNWNLRLHLLTAQSPQLGGMGFKKNLRLIAKSFRRKTAQQCHIGVESLL
jgi:hypothetical protein